MNSSITVRFHWFCQTLETAVDSLKLEYLKEYDEDNCFVDGANGIVKDQASFEIDIRQFRFRYLPQSYYICVNVTVVDAKSFIQQSTVIDFVKVTIVKGPRPVVSIACVANCEELINPFQRLVLKADCSNCSPYEPLGYFWSLWPYEPDRESALFDWDSKSESGNRNQTIVIKTGAFLDDDIHLTYIITVSGIREDGSDGMDVRRLNINQSSYGLQLLGRKLQDTSSQHLGPWAIVCICLGVVGFCTILFAVTFFTYRRLVLRRLQVLPGTTPRQATATTESPGKSPERKSEADPITTERELRDDQASPEDQVP